MHATAPTPAPKIKNYRILEWIDGGSSANVYRARDEVLHRDVALKILLPKTDDQQLRAALLHEARAASALNHPNICTIFEVGESDGQLYLAMEFVPRTLDKFVRPGGAPTETVVNFGLQISDGLAYAHDHGIIHRDLKPSNIAVTAEQRVKILDFGLARRQDPPKQDDDTVTMDGRSSPIQGTLLYAPPDVLRGGMPDQRGDIWSLGVVLYELATGRPPFQGETYAELISAILRDPPEMKLVRSAGLATILSRCLKKDPTQRYQRTSEVHAALQMLASDIDKETEIVKPKRNRLWASVALLVILVAGFALGIKHWWVPPKHFDSIAVLPLSNLSGDTDQDYLVDGMTDILITDLAKIKAFKRVISRNSVTRYKGRSLTQSMKQVARDLNVDLLLSGTVLRQQDRVRITLELVDPAEDRLIWAQDYEGALNDLMKLEGEVALAVAEQIKFTVTPEEKERLGSKPSSNPAAYTAYLKGRFYWNKRDLADLEKSRQYFQEAIDDDPGYAHAYAGLADYYVVLVNQGQQEYGRAKAAAQKALELDPTLAETTTTLAFVTFLDDPDGKTAEDEFKRSIGLNPNYATTYQWYAILLNYQGRVKEALAVSKRAQELDPLSGTINSYYGYTLYLNRQYADADQQFRRALELDSNFAIAHYFYTRLFIVEGKSTEALAHAQKAMSLATDIPAMTANLALAYAANHEKSKALQLLAKFRSSPQRPLPAEAALAYTALGENDAAFEALRTSRRDRMIWSVSLPSEPLLEPLRNDSRFKSLSAEL